MNRSLMPAALVLLIVASLPVRADVRLPKILSDNMVIQSDMAAPIWGWADAGEKVSVRVNDGAAVTTTAGADGKWRVKLPAQKAGAAVTITVEGKNTLKIQNVLVGEVWVCSGQSNMQFSLAAASNAKEALERADCPTLRLFQVARRPAPSPQDDCEGQWVVCNRENNKEVAGFSAVGYLFGRKLHDTLNVPVGMIGTSWGGTRAEAWTSEEMLKSVPLYQKDFEQAQEYVTKYPALLENYKKQLAAWEALQQAAKTQPAPPRPADAPPAKRANVKPRPPAEPGKNPNDPAVLYNGMIAPIKPLAIRGAIWYQGESNAGRANEYEQLLTMMITSWRQAWGQGDFHFGIVSLANFMARQTAPEDTPWAEIRWAQSQVAHHLNNCGQALAIDVGDAKDIHPKDKLTVSNRLAAWALAKAYGRDIPYSGPDCQSISTQGNKLVVKFAHVHGGLEFKGDKLEGFTIAGNDGKFEWADAKIVGETVELTSPKITAPVAVRYAWGNNPLCNLYNKAGFPAVPFKAGSPAPAPAQP